MSIVSVSGQLASGKDVLCDYLRIELEKVTGQEFFRKAFADQVKDTFCKAFDVDRDFIEKWKRIPEAPPGMLMPVRQGLQFIGDGFRQIRESIWIDIALRDDRNIILSDGRYINEAKAVRERKGVNILLFRPGFLNDDPNPSESQLRPLVVFCKDNLSEGPIPAADELRARFGVAVPEGLEFYDYFLVNGGSIEEFYSKISDMVLRFVCSKLDLKRR
jgi:hypothetical protein